MIAGKTVASETVRAEFDAQGGLLTSLSFRDVELLRTSDERGGVWFGAFVMAPWAGIIPSARLSFAGKDYELPANWGSDSLHGVARFSALQEEPSGLGGSLDAGWPFGGRFDLTATAGENQLALRMVLTAGEEVMPAAIGWHPWFARSLALGEPLTFDLPADARMLERTSGGAATGNWVDPGSGPWDDCFRTDESIVLRWPGAGSLRISSDGGYLSVFNGEDTGVAVEPMNAPAGSMPHTLQPGETLSLNILLEWSAE